MSKRETSKTPIPADTPETADHFKKILRTIGQKEQLLIVTGQASREFYEAVEEDIRQAHKEKQIRVGFIAGPVLSVDDNYDSPLLRLARGPKPVAILYASRFRPRSHFRIIGEQVLQREEYHSPWQVGNRQIQELRDIYSMAVYINDFKSSVAVYCHKWDGKDQSSFIKLVDAGKQRIIQNHPDFEYDFMQPEEVRQRIGEMITT